MKSVVLVGFYVGNLVEKSVSDSFSASSYTEIPTNSAKTTNNYHITWRKSNKPVWLIE